MKKSEAAEIKEKKLIRPPLKGERMTCDDFEVEQDGVTYYPHLEEYVEIIPIRHLGSLKNLMELAAYQPNENAKFGDEKLMKQYDGICTFLADSILDWNFTDENNQPLPKPFRNAKIIEQLGLDEINYLVAKLVGGRTDEAKNDLPPSPTI
jgi:hypothetical protein